MRHSSNCALFHFSFAAFVLLCSCMRCASFPFSTPLLCHGLGLCLPTLETATPMPRLLLCRALARAPHSQLTAKVLVFVMVVGRRARQLLCSLSLIVITFHFIALLGSTQHPAASSSCSLRRGHSFIALRSSVLLCSSILFSFLLVSARLCSSLLCSALPCPAPSPGVWQLSLSRLRA